MTVGTCIYSDEQLEVHQILVLKDNYVYILRDRIKGRVAVVDPSTAAEVNAFLEARGWTLGEIWNTHHHGDHIGGNEALRQRYGCRIFASDFDQSRIPNLERALRDGDHFTFGGEEVQVLFTPGHTLGHIVYVLPRTKLMFCGDTLFGLGCGRLFEGTAVQMWQSLQKILLWDDEFKVCCAHEYTLANARFAASLEPLEDDFSAYRLKLEALRQEGLPTVPSRLGDEKQWNPFLRVRDALWRQQKGLDPCVENAFAYLRLRKDTF